MALGSRSGKVLAFGAAIIRRQIQVESDLPVPTDNTVLSKEMAAVLEPWTSDAMETNK